MRLQAVTLPDLGTGPDEIILVSYWYSRRGEEVWEGDRLVEVLVGAATFDVSAPASGRLVEIRVREDERIRPGEILGRLAVDESSADRSTSDPPS